MGIILLGSPGAGKGTQGELLAQKLNLPRLSVGAILREALKEKTPQGIEAGKYMKEGLNVPPNLLFEILKVWIKKNKKGFVIDNLPRSKDQLEAFKSFMKDLNIRIDHVFHLNISEAEAVGRLLERAVEREKTGKRRIDEEKEVIMKRYHAGYLKEIGPILEYFRKEGVLEELDAERSVEEIHRDILQRIKNRKKTPRFTWIRLFDDLATPVDVQKLGSKGEFLARMTRKGLPVPPGFTITTTAWRLVNENYGKLPSRLWEEICQALAIVEQKTSKKLGDSKRPLTYSLRSGARISMPGIMKSILNLGITDKTLNGLAAQVGSVCTLDSYQRLMRSYSVAVYEIDHKKFRDLEEEVKQKLRIGSNGELTGKYYRQLIKVFKNLVKAETGREFEQDPMNQLHEGIKAIFRSYMSPAAIYYRNSLGLPHDMGTAVNFQAMVYGNAGPSSGTAVVFTHDPETGERKLSGHFLINAQGEDIVGGFSKPKSLDQLPPQICAQLKSPVPVIEKMFKDAVDLEITWENERLYFLQARRAEIPALASIRSVVDMVNEGLISQKEALKRIGLHQILTVKRPRFKKKALDEARKKNRLLAHGMPVFTGVGVGKIYLKSQSAKEAVKRGEKAVLICHHFDPNDIELIVGTQTAAGGRSSIQAIITTSGSPSSHMGLVMSTVGLAGVMGCTDIKINQAKQTMTIKGKDYPEGTIVSVDGNTGEIFRGEIATAKVQVLSPFVSQFIKEWEGVYGENNPWAAFLFPTESRLDHTSKQKLCRQIQAEVHRRWQSTKAAQVQLINSFFPKSIIIPTLIIASQNTQAIKENILKAKAQGCSVWPRSCYHPDLLLAPYVSRDLGVGTKEKEIDDWLTNADSKRSKWGGLPKWQTIEDEEGVKHCLEAILIPFDPKDKLKPECRQEHFVCTLRCAAHSTSQVIVDIRDQNYHLRSLEKAGKEQLMQIIAVANSENPSFIGQVNIKFGLEHFDLAKVKNLSLKMLSDSPDSRVKVLRRKIRSLFGLRVLNHLTQDLLIEKLQSLMKSNLLTQNDYELFIVDRSLGVANFVTKEIFHHWWAQHALPHLMWALKQVTGALVLEIQGRYRSQGGSWILIYGTKGEEEATLFKT